MKFSAENDLNDLKQWLQENEMYAENQGVSKGDSLETRRVQNGHGTKPWEAKVRFSQNYNPLRRDLQDEKTKTNTLIQWASLNKRLFPEMASTLERYVQRRISGNPKFFRFGRNPK